MTEREAWDTTVYHATEKKLKSVEVVYFARANEHPSIKIGVASDLWKRIDAIRTGCPGGIRIIGCVPGGSDRESALHWLLEPLRMNGEWFKADPVLVGLIRAVSVHPHWPLIAKLEPRLNTVLAAARDVRDTGGGTFCANTAWGQDGGLKDQMEPLVGWDRKNKGGFIATSDAYDIAYETIYNALPDCRNCICF